MELKEYAALDELAEKARFWLNEYVGLEAFAEKARFWFGQLLEVDEANGGRLAPKFPRDAPVIARAAKALPVFPNECDWPEAFEKLRGAALRPPP